MTAHTQDRAAWFVGAFERFENDLNGEAQTPLHRTRRQAIENFARGGIPTPRDEDWNYTNVAPYLRHDFEPANAEAAAALNAEALAPFLFEGEGARLVFVNGQPAGHTPLFNHTVPAGRVRLRLVVEGTSIERRVTLNAAPDQTISRNFTLQE